VRTAGPTGRYRGVEPLAGLLQADRSAVSEAKLKAVLDEIELRSAVELAKRQQVSP
jgi:Class II flagellar assembly regulator